MKTFNPETLKPHYDPNAKLQRGCAEVFLHHVNLDRSLVFFIERCDFDCDCGPPNVKSVGMTQIPSWLSTAEWSVKK